MVENRKSIVQKLIRESHAEASPQEAKKWFEEVLRDVDAVEIAKIEQKLTEEEMPRDACIQGEKRFLDWKGLQLPDHLIWSNFRFPSFPRSAGIGRLNGRFTY